MRFDIKHKLYGHSIAEHINTISDELPMDAVGLWQIVRAGRLGFGLDGDDLAEFVRQCVLALLENGAVPVVGGAGTPFGWIRQDQYGESKEGIANAVVAEWASTGRKDCDSSGLWFALPSSHVGHPDSRQR